MRLLTAQLRQYIIESWKRIIINATILMELLIKLDR